MEKDFIKTSGHPQVDRRYDMALQLARRGDTKAAIDLLQQTMEMAPHWPVISFTLGKLQAENGNIIQAQDHYKAALALDPADHLGALVELQLLGAPVLQDSLPPAHIEALFDQYAPRFETHLVETLSYSVPQLLGNMVQQFRPEKHTAKILDLGCGTGLAAEIFMKGASWIEGVDLSAGMLAEAQKKDVYHRLTQADLLHWLRETREERYDLILAADVLIYCGALDDVFAGAATHLAPGGLLAFSAQKPQQESLDYHLDESHRFSHSKAYMTRSIAAAGLYVVACEERVLRQDRGNDVTGYVFLCEKASAAISSCALITDSESPAPLTALEKLN